MRLAILLESEAASFVLGYLPAFRLFCSWSGFYCGRKSLVFTRFSAWPETILRFWKLFIDNGISVL